jgi:HD-GYP domain-containing protein (c-di-GMP phosphodiesterase class II)
MPDDPIHDLSHRAQLAAIHEELIADLPAIRRVAVAIYDRATDLLRTFLHSTDGPVPFSLLEARLVDTPSLAELAASRRDRVIAELRELDHSPSTHTRLLLERGYRSSYTRPFFVHGQLRGFVFFDADEPSYFSPAVVRHLALYSHLVSLLVIEALSPANVMRSAIDVARELTHLHDAETGTHLDRMAHYAHLIAGGVAAREGRSEEFVEFVLLFAPLHDIGKIAIPEALLLKPQALSVPEIDVMRAHVERGLALVRSLATAFGLLDAERMEILFNIVAHHHEHYDGSGYPAGLVGRQIPLEARIVTVADVFDALTSERPYKRAWSSDEAYAYLERNAGTRFDAECVRALVVARPRVEAIRKLFDGRKDGLAGFREAIRDDS